MELFECVLETGEDELDRVEVGSVRYIVDYLDLKLSTLLHDGFRMVHGQIVHENCDCAAFIARLEELEPLAERV